MGFSDSIAAYPDVEALLAQALASDKGLKLTFNSLNEATINKGRINAYRVRLRRENSKTYPEGHQMHGKTIYDGLMIRQKETIVIIEKLSLERFDIEELK